MEALAESEGEATRTERADDAVRERACRGVRGAQPLDTTILGRYGADRRTSDASEATRTERADDAVRERACRGVRGAKPRGN